MIIGPTVWFKWGPDPLGGPRRRAQAGDKA